MRVCACVCACVHVRACVRVCARVHLDYFLMNRCIEDDTRDY